MISGRISPRKMVKNKNDIKYSPRRNRPLRRSLSRVGARSCNSASCANVKVIVRVRPPNHKEFGNNQRTVIKVVEDNVIIFDPKEDDEPFYYHGVQQRGRDLLKKANKNIQFIFDRVFGYDSDNADVFNHSTKNLISSIMDGYNCSVFVYGATGAGKTHTMLGHNGNPGITFLTMQELFSEMKELHNEREFELGITYLEVYNENVKDLLNPGAPLHLREDGKFGVCVAGIQIHRIKNPDELFALLAKGNANRTQHPTDANAESSRSHAVFQVYVNMKYRSNGQRRIAKLSMIDLAGSERGAATGCSGMRFTEGANINKSLLALGNCINSLADGQRHIPYRDSKLTRLLKDSLGGNCQTVMIANISPSSLNYEDTYNTLKYATRAKKIKSTMTKNVVSCTLTIPQYKKIVEDLTTENESLKSKLNELKSTTTTTTTNSCSCNIEDKLTTKPEPAWKAQLQSLLTEKINIQKQMQRLLNSEEILRYRMKLKENSEAIMSDLCVNQEQLDTGRNRIHNTMGAYERQAKTLSSQIMEIKTQDESNANKLQVFMQENEIPEENELLLQADVNIKSDQNELQREHINKVLEFCQSEVEQKDKLMAKMSEILNQFFLILLNKGELTDEIYDSYRNIVKLAQQIRMVTWKDENDVTDIKSQDSGISVNPQLLQVPLAENIQISTPISQGTSVGSSGKRTVKRKLYEVETKSTSAIDNYIKKYLTNKNESKTTPNLNETVTLPQTINSDAIDNLCLHDREISGVPKKKTALTDRCNTAENLPKANKIVTGRKPLTGKDNTHSMNNKYFSSLSKAQRFPLRNNSATANSNRMVKTPNTKLRLNVHRFNL